MVTCLLSIINYSKLDGASEAHKTSSHQYDKLQSSVEFKSGSILLFHDLDIHNDGLNKGVEGVKGVEGD